MTDRIFLTREEVKLLTGTADRKRQATCLRDNRIPYTLDIIGRPVVTLAAVQGSKMAKDEEPKQSWAGPSFLRAA
jgi:hypothetical protein